MPVNFDALVLGPCMATFALPVVVDPSVSIPLSVPYVAQGIFTSRPHDVMLIDGTIVSDMETTLGIRLSDFPVPPVEGDRITVKAVKPTRMMFLGGDALEGPRHIWWNFVSSSKERIEQAKQDWKSGRFAHVPNEHEFIPLPE